MEKSLGDRIKLLRLEKGLTQEELGNLLGVKKAAVQKYENGIVVNIKNEKLKKMTEIFGCSMDYLMGWKKFDEKYDTQKLANEVKELENNKLPPLTAKDEREVAKALEAIIQDFDSQNALAAYNDTDDEEDRELLRASLENTMRLAKQMAKKKFTPKKYRKD